MKSLLFSFLAATGGAAAAVTFGQLPEPSFPDTEVVTNVPFSFLCDHAGRFVIELDFTATPSNNVEVAFGADADADGVLAPEEEGLSFGWDCGRWRLSVGAAGPVHEAVAATNCMEKALSWSLRLVGGTTPRRLTLTENGLPLFSELSGDPPAGLYDGDWTLVRVRARGVDAPGERLAVAVKSDSFILRLR